MKHLCLNVIICTILSIEIILARTRPLHTVLLTLRTTKIVTVYVRSL